MVIITPNLLKVGPRTVKSQYLYLVQIVLVQLHEMGRS